MCLSSPGSSELCKTVQFNLPYSSLEQTHRHHTYEVLHSCHCLFSFTNGQQISQLIQELHPREGFDAVKLHHPLILVVTVLFKHLSVSSLQVQLTERATFGVPVVVQVDSQSHGQTHIANITVSSLEEGKFVHFHGKADNGLK